MSSTPVVPVTPAPVTSTVVPAPKPAAAPAAPPAPKETLAQEIVAVEKKIGLWLDPAHIVLIILLAVAILTGVYLYESKQVAAEHAKAVIAEQVLVAAQKAQASEAIQNAAQQAASAATEEEMKAANAQLALANQQLISSNQQLVQKLLTQQKTDATLPPTGQAARIEQLEPKATVAAIAGGFTVDAPGGLAILQDLEELPIDRTTIVNLDAVIKGDDQTIANDAVALTAEKTAHASDVKNDAANLTVANDKLKKTTDDFQTYKHKARRNYIKAFVLGFVAGLAGGHAMGI